jgi:hypothetical protein
VAFASAGIGSANHLASEVFRAAAGARVEMVQYRGGGPAMQAVIGGEAHMCVDPVASALGHIRGGTVRPIAVAGATRSAALPEVPSASEAGLPGFAAAAWIAAFAPARTPPAAVAALNAAFNEAMRRLEPRLTELAIERRPELAAPRRCWSSSARTRRAASRCSRPPGCGRNEAGAAGGARARRCGPAGARAKADGVSWMASSGHTAPRGSAGGATAPGSAVVSLIVSMAKRLVTSVSPGVSVSRL